MYNLCLCDIEGFIRRQICLITVILTGSSEINKAC